MYFYPKYFLEIYNQVFFESFKVNSDQLDTVKDRSISGWDSIRHMILIAALEERFHMMMELNKILFETRLKIF
jgi:acyl carrier protein